MSELTKCSTSPKAMEKYCTMIKALLIEEEGDQTGFVYFADNMYLRCPERARLLLHDAKKSEV
jgi:hypothetical protein